MTNEKKNSWDYSKYPNTLIEAIILHAFYMGLGYKAEEIFVILAKNGVIVELKSGGKSLPSRMGDSELPLEEMKRKWEELIAEWNTGGCVSQEDVDRIWKNSRARQLKTHIIEVLMRLGMTKGLENIDGHWN